MTEPDQNQDDTAGDFPDRAEEKRVDVPQNETAAPVEAAQATDAAPTETVADGDLSNAHPNLSDAMPTEAVTPEDSGEPAQPSTDAPGAPDNA